MGKRIATTVGLMLIAVLSAHAIGISVGARIGAGHAFFYGDDYTSDLESFDAERQFRFGLEAGGFIEFALSDVLAIQPEIIFVRGGGNFGGESSVGEFTVEETFNYISVPLLVKAGFPTAGGRVFVFAGPSVKFQVGDAEVDAEEAGVSLSGNYDEEIIAPVVASGVAGLGFEIPLGFNWFFIDARGHVDFMSVFDEDEPSNYDQRGAGVLLGAGFGIVL
jgi:hypothetical protein